MFPSLLGPWALKAGGEGSVEDWRVRSSGGLVAGPQGGGTERTRCCGPADRR
jgi:hypothetical protein